MDSKDHHYDIHPMEKLSQESPGRGFEDNSARVVEEKGTRIAEAADMYGDLETAEDFGYVSRG